MERYAHYAVVPDPKRERVLAVDGRLPCFESEAHRLVDVLEGFAGWIGEPPYLRLAAEAVLGDVFLRLHVFDAGEGPAVPFDDVRVPRQLRPEYERWAAEQRGAPVPELRSAWARPGWLEEVQAWAGLPLRPARVWSLSAVLRSGDVWFKAVFPLFHHEPAVTQALARTHPRHVTELVRVDHARGWMLMRELRGRKPDDLAAPLRTLGEIQRAWCDRTGELLALGAPDRSLAVLESQVAGLVGEVAPDLVNAVPALEAACRDADFPTTVVHGDFHPGNAVVDDDGVVVIFDWSDACVSNPLFDLHVFSIWSDDAQPLIDAYSEGWGEDVSDALARAAAPSCLHQAVSYRAIQAGSEEKFWFEGEPRRWIERAVELVT
jgi:aminoglycoside phosphotransferase (APT) family kinase protein